MKAFASAHIEVPNGDPYPFRSERRSTKALQMFGMFQGYSSIANVCRQVAMALASVPGGLAIQSTNGVNLPNPELNDLVGLNSQAPVALYWGIPETVPAGIFSHSVTIGAFVCEIHTIPNRWARIANRFDLLIFPSSFCRDVFRAAGVTRPALVVPHGIETNYRPGDTPPSKPFVFYNALGSSFFERKGTDILVRAFKRAFSGREDVELRLRVGDKAAVDAVIESAGLEPGMPSIKVEPTQDLSTAEFAAIYSQVHCTVHPTRGEGFGLIPMQSLACATPVITPIHSGLAEYLRPEWVTVLDSSAPESTDINGLHVLSESQLIEKLQEVISDYAQAKARAVKAAEEIHDCWTWPQVLAPFIELMSKITSGDPVESILPALDV